MKKISFYLFSLIGLFTSCYQGDTADLIIHNAKIYSFDDQMTVYDAMAIRDGHIVQMGPEREILNGYKSDEVIDMQMNVIYPGFIDAHGHFLGLGQTLSQVDLRGVKSMDELMKRVVQYHQEFPDKEWIVGFGWDETLWNEPINHNQLSEKFPDIPVSLSRIDGHAVLANQKALDLASIDIYSEWDGGKALETNGQLTGVLVDKAADELKKIIPETDDETKKEWLKRAERELYKNGVTSIADAGVDDVQRKFIMDLYQQGELSIGNYMMLFPTDGNMDFASKTGEYFENNLHIKSFKILADGSLGSGGACLKQPYSDDSLNWGHLLVDEDELESIGRFVRECGYQLNTHSIGDSATSVVLKVYVDLLSSISNHRWRIEHAQFVSKSDLDIFQNYMIIPSVQPTHATSDLEMAPVKLGVERLKMAYAYNDLLQKSGLIAVGTDFPVEGVSPILTFYAAVVRKNLKGKPQNGFQMENALNRQDALKGMTRWAAYANFEEDLKGTLEAGKQADFVVLTQDLMKVDEDDILNTFVLHTYVKGQEVYSAE